MLTLLAELEAKRVDLYLDRQGVDTTTPSGRALIVRFSGRVAQRLGQTLLD